MSRELLVKLAAHLKERTLPCKLVIKDSTVCIKITTVDKKVLFLPIIDLLLCGESDDFILEQIDTFLDNFIIDVDTKDVRLLLVGTSNSKRQFACDYLCNLPIVPVVRYKNTVLFLTKDLCIFLGQDYDSLVQIGRDNMENLNFSIVSIVELLEGFFKYPFKKEFDEIKELMVCSLNGEVGYGASILLNKKALIAMSRYFEEGCYVLPSSIHEVLICPKRETFGGNLESIVRDVNAMMIKGDILSDSVYYLDYDSDELKEVR